MRQPFLAVMILGALKLLDGLVGYGLCTRKRRAYATPACKELLNLPNIFDKPYR
jgi:hypothetical protein